MKARVGMLRTALLSTGCMLWLAGTAGAQNPGPATSGGVQGPPGQRQAQADAGQAAVALRMRFQVLERTLSPEEIERVNHSPESVDLEALALDGAADGKLQVKHVFDAALKVGDAAEFTNSARVPLVRGSASTGEGKPRPQVTYDDVGCRLRMHTYWVDVEEQARLTVFWQVEIDDVYRDGSVMCDEVVACPNMQSLEQDFRTIVRVGSDEWFSSLTSHRDNAGGQPVTRVYLYRVRFDRLEEG